MPTAIADGQQHEKYEERVEIVGDKVEGGQDLVATLANESAQLAERQRRVLPAPSITETGRTRGGGGGTGTKIICDNETKKREGGANRASIDSRSILNNKQRLKKFWERRMELDSKRVQSGQEIKSENNKMTPRHRPAAMAAKRQNSSQDSIKLTSGKQMEFSPQRDDCDSPPPPPPGQDENNNDSGEQGGHVSAELLCEKLLAYEQTQRRSTRKGPEVPNGQQTRPTAVAAEQGNSQPMSIDPTLCHVNTARTTTTATASDQDELDEEQDEEQVANEEFGSSNSSIVGPSQSSSSGAQANDNRQTLSSTAQAPKRSRSASLDSGDSQEETSTQSGSVLTVISGNNNNSNNNEKKSTLGANNGEELAGGRATPTLITSLEDEQEARPLVDFGDDQSATLGGGGGAESDGSNIGVAFESLHFDDEIKSSRSEQVDEERLLAGLGHKKPVLPVPVVGSLVAMKTRATIKLADEDGAQHNNDEQQQQQRRGDKFSSREVRSVCALITSAISDAGRQVEGYLRQSSLASAHAHANAKVDAVSDDVDDDDETPITPPTNHNDGRESSDEELESRDGFRRATFVARSESRQLTNQRQRVEQVATIGYLADEDEDEDDCEEDGEDEDDQERQLSSPRADLSSIFEANVRREIERFESNTMLRRQQCQPGGCGQKSAGLTEWRIAEEIRLFNEREKELKQRCKSTTIAHKMHRQQGATVAPPGGGNAKCQQQEQQQLESIVRFGKTLQIPKPASDTHQSASATTSRSIKLTTKGAAPSQPATTISMHKFISSGGKRFVYQTAQVNSSSSSSQDIAGAPQLRGLSSRISTATASTANHPTTLDNHLTKSMSNLSTCATPTSATGRQVDYRAVDSLKCKEVPNVAPGYAKKTIETFARLNSESSLNKLGAFGSQDRSSASVGGSMASNLNSDHSARGAKSGTCTNSSSNLNNGRVQHSHQHQQQPMTHGAASIPTAEWKIQEELREMKARETELRSLRNQQRQQQQQQPALPLVSKPKQHNPIVANVKPVQQQQQQQQQHQRLAATEHVNGGDGAGKQRIVLTRPNRFRKNHDADEEIAPNIHSAHLMSNGGNDNRDNHDNLEFTSDDDNDNVGSDDHESGCERIRPVNARGGGVGGCGTHAYQHKSTSQHNGSGNSTLVSGSCGPDDLAGGSDSLYPIKQTIDSFRKLNQQSAPGGESSGDCNNNNSSGNGQVSMTSAHRSASSGPATNRVRANKKQTPPPPVAQGKQFVNSSSVGPQRPT